MNPADEMVAKLEAILSDFDADVAEHLANESERSDLWSEVDMPVSLVREIAALIRSLAAEREQDAKQIHRLQAALAYWLPSVTDDIEIELNGKAGDDAYLLTGFTGDVQMPSWGDTAITRATTAEAERDALRKVLGEEGLTVNYQIDAITKQRDAAEAKNAVLREREMSSREFVKRHPALTLIDLAEFEAFLKMGEAFDRARAAAGRAKG